MLTDFLNEEFLSSVYKKIDAYKRVSLVQSALKESLDFIKLDQPDFNFESVLDDAIFRLKKIKSDFNDEIVGKYNKEDELGIEF